MPECAWPPSRALGWRHDHRLLSRHRDRLDAAVAASASRGYYSAFDESPSPRVYGETAAADGKAAFEAWLGGDFPLSTPGVDGTVATERSPYGFDLGVRYPRSTPRPPSTRCWPRRARA